MRLSYACSLTNIEPAPETPLNAAMKSFLLVSAAYLLGDSAAVADRDGQFLSKRTSSGQSPWPDASEDWMVESLRAPSLTKALHRDNEFSSGPMN